MRDVNQFPSRRIVVVGTSGSGKSYVAKKLASALGVPYICNDAIIWRGNWKPAPKAERFDQFDQATRGQGWTYDGNIGTLKDREDIMILERADTLVWLDFPKMEVMRQLLIRTIRRAWKREELWHGNIETWRGSFASSDSILCWAWKTYASRRRQYGAIFADSRWRHLTKVRLRSRASVNRWVDAITGKRSASRRG